MSSSAKPAHSGSRHSPNVVYGVVALVIAAGATILLRLWLGWNAYWLWLLVVNVVAFVFYRYDKHQAVKEAMRVPEVDLLLLTLLGGFIGAGAAMYMHPRHKVRKPKFVLALGVGAIIQIAVIYLLFLR
jgi:uncharacterized membrane protein YsdA (DUF1294 family)